MFHQPSNDWAFRQRYLQVFCLKWIESFESHHPLTVFDGTNLGPPRPYTSWVQLTISLPDSLPLKIGLNAPKGRPEHLPTIHFSGAKNVTFREGNGLKFWKFLLLERSSIQTFLYIGAPAIPTIWRTSCWRTSTQPSMQKSSVCFKIHGYISIWSSPPHKKCLPCWHVDCFSQGGHEMNSLNFNLPIKWYM